MRPKQPSKTRHALVIAPALAQLGEEGVAAGLRAEGGEDALGQVARDDLSEKGFGERVCSFTAREWQWREGLAWLG